MIESHVSNNTVEQHSPSRAAKQGHALHHQKKTKLNKQLKEKWIYDNQNQHASSSEFIRIDLTEIWVKDRLGLVFYFQLKSSGVEAQCMQCVQVCSLMEVKDMLLPVSKACLESFLAPGWEPDQLSNQQGDKHRVQIRGSFKKLLRGKPYGTPGFPILS